MGNEAVNLKVGQSFGTFEELKAKLESMAKRKREDINTKIVKTEEKTTYLDIKGNEIGSVLAGTKYQYGGNTGIYIESKDDIKNIGLIEIGDVAYFIPTIRDGKGGQVNKITVNGKIVAYDKNKDGIIGDDELYL